MRANRVLGYACTALSALAFIGFMNGANHQLFIAIAAAITAIVAFSQPESKPKNT